jgi:hypothetical protein
MARGQVEKNVRDSRHQMLQSMPGFPDLAALNAWLEQRCLELWRETAHGKQPPLTHASMRCRATGTIADVWAEEQAALMPLPVAFDGFIELSKRVSPTCLISFERNRYSVPCYGLTRPPLWPRSLRTLREPASQPSDLSRSTGRGGRGQHPV